MFRSLFRSFRVSSPRSSRQLNRRPFVEALEDRNLLAIITVGTGQQFATIGAGVAAANAGDTVEVFNGTYTEQVTITKSITLENAATNTPIIQAPTSLVSNFPSDTTNAIVAIGGGATVDVHGFTIQGPVPASAAPTAAQTIDAGIYVAEGASANIHNNTILNIANSPLNGVASTGDGISVGDDTNNTTGSATIANNVISGYQKDGISVLNSSTASVSGNTVTGVGPTSVLATNGIVIGSSSVAQVSGNTVSGNEFTGTGSGSDPTNDTQAVGILLDTAGLGTTVTGNAVDANDIGIYSSNQGTAASPIPITNNNLGLVSANIDEGALLEQGDTFFASNTVKGGIEGVAVISFANPAPTANSVAVLSADGISGAVRGVHIYVDTTGSTGGFAPAVTINASTLGSAGGLENQILSNTIGIQLDAGTLSITQSLINNNTTTGLNVTGGSLVAIPGNVMKAAVDQNFFNGNGIGITISGGSVGLIYDNSLAGNSSSIFNNSASAINANGDFFITQTNQLSPLPSDSVVAATIGGTNKAGVNFQGYINNGTDASGAAGYQSNANERGVDGSYFALLGRFPETGGKTPFVVALNSNQTNLDAVAVALASSTEYRTDQIVQYYRRFLNRTPSGTEIQGQLAAFASGANLQQVEAGILSSTEFFNDAGGTNSGYVSNLYFLVLGRAPDAGGLANYVATLGAGVTRNAVALSFVTSNEASTVLLNNAAGNLPVPPGPQNAQSIPLGFYESFLGRVASQAEVSSYFSVLGNPQPQGGSIPAVAGAFLGSNEYVNSASL